MKGHPEVVDYLKQLLRGELAPAINISCIRAGTRIRA